MSRSFLIVAGVLVVSVFIITTREALPTKSTELTEASVPDGENIKLGADLRAPVFGRNRPAVVVLFFRGHARG
jgi:hypothetical protein